MSPSRAQWMPTARRPYVYKQEPRGLNGCQLRDALRLSVNKVERPHPQPS
jgi:hypothetical protein